MRYIQLVEYNKPDIIKRASEAFLKRFRAEAAQIDIEIPKDANSLEVVLDSLDQQLQQANISKIIDPYIKWIIHRYTTGGIQRWEDVMARVIPGLVRYDKLKKKKKLQPDEMDINRFKTESELLDVIEKYQDVDLDSQAGQQKSIERQFYDSGGARLIMNTSEYKIVSPKTHEASCYFGKNTRWCTSSSGLFNNYNRQGPLYVILHKPTNRRWQFHYPSKQYMDEKDSQIDLLQFAKDHKEVMKGLATQPDASGLIKFFGTDNPSEEIQIEGINDKPEIYRLIKNPSKNIKMAAMFRKPSWTIDILESDGIPTSYSGPIGKGVKELKKYQPKKVEAMGIALDLIEKNFKVRVKWKTISWELIYTYKKNFWYGTSSHTKNADKPGGIGAKVEIFGIGSDNKEYRYMYRQGDEGGNRSYQIDDNQPVPISNLQVDAGMLEKELSPQIRKLFR